MNSELRALPFHAPGSRDLEYFIAQPANAAHIRMACAFA